MTVRLVDAATIALEGACPVEDAEPLLQHLLAAPDAIVDWRACDDAHSAVLQVLLIARAPLRGPPRGALLRDVLEPVIEAARTGQTSSKQAAHRLDSKPKGRMN